MSEYTVTIHAIQTFKIDKVVDAHKAIEKATKKLNDSEWQLMDAVAVDTLNNSFTEEFYDDNRGQDKGIVLGLSHKAIDYRRYQFQIHTFNQ